MAVKMRVRLVTYDFSLNEFLVILSDLEDRRALPMIIGSFEANVILMKMNKTPCHRPMSHDLIRNILGVFDSEIVKVEVTELRNDVYYALIHIKSNGRELIIDSRPSDAIALAVRVDAPIYAEEVVLDKAGILLDKETGKPITDPAEAEKSGGRKVSEEELKKMSAFYDFINSLDMEDFDQRKS